VAQQRETTRDDSLDDADRAPGEADYYAVLGVASDASHEAIHSAYRRLAKLWHPDRYSFAPDNLRERAERRMRAVSEAWNELGDPLRRRAYDQRHYSASWSPVYQPPAAEKFGGNGAGMFAGMLCVILALPLVINLLNGNLHETWQVAAVAVLALALAGLAGMFFTNDSSLARMATNWAEGDPRGFHDQSVVPPNRTSPGFAFDVAGDVAGDVSETGDDDEERERAQAFDHLVEQALQTIPDEFQHFMENVLVRVKREPMAEELAQLEVGPGGTLFGLYTGVPLTAQGMRPVGTEFVTIYRGPIERFCQGDPERIREQVRRTVLHEMAHHFGIDHDQMPDWLK
jgi:predicted Zn-dependent protease with MMP-like domain/DnaJ-domain-containing protein 1